MATQGVPVVGVVQGSVVQGQPVAVAQAVAVARPAPAQPQPQPQPQPPSVTQSLLANSFPAGSITGIRIRVHPFLPLTTFIYAISYALRFGAAGFGLGLLVFGPVLWMAVLFHELWHCWAAKHHKILVDEILLWPLGGLAFIGQSPTPCADISVAAAGPASHVPQVLLWLGFLAAANDGSLTLLDNDPRTNFAGAMCYDALIMNAGMAIFNLCLPCYPLDGGRIFADALLTRGIPPERAAAIVVRVSAAIVLGLLIYGIYVILDAQASRYDATLLPAHAFVVFLLAAWLTIQTQALNTLQQRGLAHLHPLFASAALAAARDHAATIGEAPPPAATNPAVSQGVSVSRV